MAYSFFYEKNKFTIAGNHKYKETNSINSVQSSLKSQGNPSYEKFSKAQNKIIILIKIL